MDTEAFRENQVNDWLKQEVNDQDMWSLYNTKNFAVVNDTIQIIYDLV